MKHWGELEIGLVAFVGSFEDEHWSAPHAGDNISRREILEVDVADSGNVGITLARIGGFIGIHVMYGATHLIEGLGELRASLSSANIVIRHHCEDLHVH